MGKYYTVQVNPDMNFSPAAGYAGNDILFNWTPFEIPTGTAMLRSMQIQVAGTNGAAGNAKQMALYFAKSINGEAPSLFGVPNAAQSATLSQIDKAHIIAHVQIIDAAATDGGGLIGFNMWDGLTGSLNVANIGGTSIIIEGDVSYPSTTGYQTIWMAAVSLESSFEFGTDIQLNQVGNQAADMTGDDVTLTIEQGGDGAGVANNSFAAGDILVGSTHNGTTGPTMEVTDVINASATTIKVKNISEQIDNNEELILLNPLRFTLGFEN